MACPRYSSAWLAAGLTFWLAGPSYGEDFPLQEYERHVSRFLASLEGLACAFTVTDHAVDGSFKVRDECSLISIPGHFRAKTMTQVAYKDGRQSSKTEWALLRPDGYFEITEKADGEFLFKAMQKSINSPLLVDSTTPVNILTQPICGARRPLLRLLRGEYGKTHVFKATTFRRHPGNSEKGYTLLVTGVVNGGKVETEFELNDRWLFSRITTTSLSPETAGSRLTIEINYTKLGDRVLPSTITIKRTDPTGQSATPGYLAEFRDYKLYRGSPAEFSLSQFGFPEAMGASTIYQAQSQWYLWLIAIAVVALGLGLYVHYRRT